jgi:hypothetical protein
MVIRLHDTGILSEGERQIFERQANAGLLQAAGPTFDFRVVPPIKGELQAWPSDQLGYAADVSQDISLMAGATMGTVIAPLVQRLSSTAIPIFWADYRLPPDLRESAYSWGDSALAPIADVYLRLRLAQSDVERFMVSLEAIELLVKISAIVLVAISWRTGEVDKGQRVDGLKLTLGNWRESLEWAVEKSRMARTGIGRSIIEFWQSPSSGMQKSAVELVAKSGILQGESGSLYPRRIDWLTWFVDLRNSTRGHGVVEEGRVASFWEILYNILLEMVDGLGDLTRSSVLMALDQAGNEYPLLGWLRKEHRAWTPTLPEPKSLINATVLNVPGCESLPLFPLIIAKGLDVLFWDGWIRKGDRDKFQALSYSTGVRFLIQLTSRPQMDLSAIWSEGGSANLEIEISRQ